MRKGKEKIYVSLPSPPPSNDFLFIFYIFKCTQENNMKRRLETDSIVCFIKISRQTFVDFQIQ